MSSTSLLLETLQTPKQMKDFLNRQEIYKDMAEWHYPLRDGTLQIFPANDCRRRWSLDEQSQYDGIQPHKNGIQPHKADDEQHRSVVMTPESRSYETRDQLYKLNDGWTIVFPAAWTSNRRYSYDDNGEVDNDVYTCSEVSVSAEPSETSSTNGQHPQSPSKICKISRVLTSIIILPLALLLACFLIIPLVPLACIIILPLASLDLLHRMSTAPSQRSEEDSEKEKRKGFHRVLGIFCFPVIAPIAVPALCFFPKLVTDDKEVQRTKKNVPRRNEFEDLYITRHRRPSKPYIQSRVIRERFEEWHAQRWKRRQKLLIKILKSVVGWPSGPKITDPEERKKEWKERFQAWAEYGMEELEKMEEV